MIRDIGSQAYEALRHNRRRSFLTMLGMAWGIATVVLLLAYGNGFERGLMIAFRSFGGNLMGVFPGRTSLQAGGSNAGTEVHLTPDDIEYLNAEVPSIKRISPEENKQSRIAYGTRSATFNVRGTFASYERIRSVEIAEGTYFGDAEDQTHTRVAVLGYDVKKKLFSGQNAMGEAVRIDGISYQVIGVGKHTITNGDDNMNGNVFIPYSAMSDLKNTRNLDGIFLDYEGDHEKVAKAVHKYYGKIAASKKKNPDPRVEPAQKEERMSVLSLPVQVEKAYFGYKVPDARHPDQVALSVLSMVLSTGRSSPVGRPCASTPRPVILRSSSDTPFFISSWK